MQQIKVSLEDPQVEFVNRFRDMGYKDKSALVRAAIAFLAEEYARTQLEQSADLYAELYATDDEMREWTDL
jgi:Arc/MetJ-type ribon-helix-helix transcriptional regulator